MCLVVSWVFGCDPSSVPRARRVVRRALAGWNVPDVDPAQAVVDDLELVVAELAGNAGRFCRGRFRVTLEGHRDRLRVEVVDDGTGVEPLELRPLHPAPDAESGRGLVIVSAVATRWGAERTTTSVDGGSGTTVWAELTFPRPSPHFTRGCQLVGAGGGPGTPGACA